MGTWLLCWLFDPREVGFEGFGWLRSKVSLLQFEVFVGEVEAMQTGEMFEMRVEVGDGFAAAEFDEDVVFHSGEDGEEGCAGCGTMECLGEYAGQFGVGFEFAMGGVEAAERGG